MKNALILVILALLFWFGSTIVKLESYNYGAMVGMCSEFSILHERHECLLNAETRTHWIYHLLYALDVL